MINTFAMKTQPGESSPIGGAFVAEGSRELDPSLLDKTAVERLPQPTGWRVLVMPYRPPNKTAGGLLLTDDVIDRQTLATVVAYVLEVGPSAYADKERFGEKPWCKKGDWVCIGRYAGARFHLSDGEIRIINDDEVIATILDPSDIHSI